MAAKRTTQPHKSNWYQIPAITARNLVAFDGRPDSVMQTFWLLKGQNKMVIGMAEYRVTDKVEDGKRLFENTRTGSVARIAEATYQEMATL